MTRKEICITEYHNGLTNKEISEKYDIPITTVNVYLRGIKPKPFSYHDYTEEQREEIKNKYLSGNSTVVIGKEYGVSHKVIARTLESMGIARTGESRRKYKLDEHYMDVIDTPEKAYILGFFYADGSVNTPKQTVAMSLQEEDGYILERIRNCFSSEKPLEYLDYSNKHDFGYSYKNQYRLLFFSKYLCKELINKGMLQNKSLILEYPEWMPEELHRHFIRGYFDGDGSIVVHKKAGHKTQTTFSITSTEKFCKSVQNILINELDIGGGNIYDASCHNGITRCLSINGNIQTKKIFDWLYSDTDFYLTRKYEKYINAFYNNDSLSA
jgi:intein-encoded DNA endonuclease-like protein